MLYIVRHGQTDLNSRNVLQGRSDHPLNPKGEEQARGIGDILSDVRFDRVFSSPLKRAVRTAEIIVPYAPMTIDERLIEMEYGPYEGLGLDSLPVEVLEFFSDFVNNSAPEGMEPLPDIVSRTGSFIEERCRIDGDVLISTHAIAMKGILEYLTPDSNGSYWSKYIGNCSVYTAEYRDCGFTVPKELVHRSYPQFNRESVVYQFWVKDYVDEASLSTLMTQFYNSIQKKIDKRIVTICKSIEEFSDGPEREALYRDVHLFYAAANSMPLTLYQPMYC